ncbi:MAG: cytochrome c oxidase subunit 3 [Armatimonadota bacterium]
MAKTKVRARSPLRGEGIGGARPPYRFGGGDGNEPSYDPVSAVRWGMRLFLIAITMMFGALAMVYLLRLPARADFPFELPRISWLSTAVILISSLSMQYALVAARRGRLRGLRNGLALTFALGGLFLMLQVMSWLALQQGVAANIFSGLFYLFTGLHGLHLLGGLVFLAYLLYGALRNAYHPNNLLPVEMGALYWHFLGALWVALFALMHVR